MPGPFTPRPAVAARPLLANRPRLRFIEGAADGAGATPPAGGQDGTPPAAPPAGAPAPTPQPPAPAAPAAAAESEPKLGDDSYVRKLRDEAAANRVAAKEAREQADKTQKQLEELTAQLRQRDLESAVRTIAAKPDIDGNAAALLDSRALTTKLKSVDPTDTAAVEAAVKGVLDARPDLKNSPKVPASSGSSTHTGGHSSKTPNLLQSIEQQLTPKGN